MSLNMYNKYIYLNLKLLFIKFIIRDYNTNKGWIK